MTMKKMTAIFILAFVYSIVRILYNHHDCSTYLEQLNKTQYKKRKKGSSFIEWLFFTRFKKQLPDFLFYGYAIDLFSAPVITIAFVILAFLREYVLVWQIMHYTFVVWFFADLVWFVILRLIFHPPGESFYDVDFRRWIKRNGKKWHDD